MTRLLVAGLAIALSAVVAAGDTTVPPAARAFLDKGDLAREEGRMEEAAGHYKKAIEAHPLYVKAHAGFLASLRGMGDMAQAAMLYSRLIGEHPDSVELKAFAAASKDRDDAAAALTELADTHGGNLRVQIELTRALLAIGKAKDAEKAAKEALKIDGDSLVARVLLGDCYLATKKVSKARKEFKAVVDSDPSYVPAQLRLALAWHLSKKSTEGLKILARLLSEDNLPRLVAGHWMLASIRADMGKFDDAVKSMDKVLEIDKDDADAFMAKGRLLLRAQKPMEAAKVFNKMVELRKDLASAYFALGWSYEKGADAPEIQPAQQKERLVAAANAYTKCTEIDPTVRPRDSLGFVYLWGEEHGEAVTQFKRASDIDPSFAPTQNNLGLAQDIADNRKLAKQRYEQVLKKLDKNNIRARVMLALNFYLDGSSAKAVKELQKVLREAPDDDLAWTFLGDVHYDARKYEKAISAYKKATDLNEKNFHAWYHMGIAYDDKKKDENADRCYRKALEAKADPPADLLLRLAEINEEEALNRLKDALQFYKLYRDLGGTEDWVPDRIKEIEDILASEK
ncbi:MAG: tetratricopeptide repeat protein [Planctomycetota bacterium]